jgi:hypothetical protein
MTGGGEGRLERAQRPIGGEGQTELAPFWSHAARAGAAP